METKRLTYMHRFMTGQWLAVYVTPKRIRTQWFGAGLVLVAEIAAFAMILGDMGQKRAKEKVMELAG